MGQRAPGGVSQPDALQRNGMGPVQGRHALHGLDSGAQRPAVQKREGAAAPVHARPRFQRAQQEPQTPSGQARPTLGRQRPFAPPQGASHLRPEPARALLGRGGAGPDAVHADARGAVAESPRPAPQVDGDPESHPAGTPVQQVPVVEGFQVGRGQDVTGVQARQAGRRNWKRPPGPEASGSAPAPEGSRSGEAPGGEGEGTPVKAEPIVRFAASSQSHRQPAGGAGAVAGGVVKAGEQRAVLEQPLADRRRPQRFPHEIPGGPGSAERQLVAVGRGPPVARQPPVGAKEDAAGLPRSAAEPWLAECRSQPQDHREVHRLTGALAQQKHAVQQAEPFPGSHEATSFSVRTSRRTQRSKPRPGGSCTCRRNSTQDSPGRWWCTRCTESPSESQYIGAPK